MTRTDISKRAVKASRILFISVRALWMAALLALGLGAIPSPAARAAAPGLPFHEDFGDTTLRDSSLTDADWSTPEGALLLARREPRYGTFGPASTGVDISADTRSTWSVALGDIDGDGDLDLVSGNRYGQTNRFYLNNGSAAPFTGVSGLNISTDQHDTFSVALGDADRDGDLDMVAGNRNQPNRLYLNNGTASPFSGVSGFVVSADAHDTRSVALGDVDGDGDLDLVAGNRNQANRLYLNNGTADPFYGVSGLDVGADAQDTRSIALGDVDGDGDLDVVAGNVYGANRLYLNNGSAAPFSGVSGVDVTADAHDTTSVALGDVDGDGDLDLVAGNASQMDRLYLNNGTAAPFAGVGGLDVSADTHETTSVVLGDVDGDGDLDLMAGNHGQVNRLYLNDGTAGSFSKVNVGADAHDTMSVGMGDVDGDGDLDLVAGNDGQVDRLYLNSGTASPFSGVSGIDVSADTHRTETVALGDMDGDGDLDLVVGNTSYQVNRLYLNNGTASPFSGVSGVDISADAQVTNAVALGDVDGDGDLDAVAGNWGPNRLYLNNGTADPFGGVSGLDISADTHHTEAVALGDVDGDGDLDLVVGNGEEANRLYLNNGTADPFGGVSGIDVGAGAHNTYSVALGDVDRDGDLDLIAGNWGLANRLYLNNGTADPFGGVSGVDISADAYQTTSMALGDVDGDGDLDLVAGNEINQANRLYLNNGTADPFGGVSGVDISTDTHSTKSVALGDVDRDRDLDLVAGNQVWGGQVNRLYLNNGTADPFRGVSGVNVSADAHETFSVALGDMDRDGDLDLMAGNWGQTNRLYLNNSTVAPFTGVSGLDVSPDVYYTLSAALGDVDGDGDLDLVAGNMGWAGETGKANRLYLNNGTADPFRGVGGADVTADAHSTRAVALGDVDGDGDLDVVAANWGQANRLYLNNGTANPFSGVAGADITTDAHDTAAIALGDVDGDGDLDLVAGNWGQRNRLYLNNGTADPFAGMAGRDVSADAQATALVALGDVDGDGDLDLVAGNMAQRNRLYLNNGTADPFAGATGADISADAYSTQSVILGDVDGDGDLDLVAGNHGQRNRLYVNNGAADPFSGVAGADITTDAHDTAAIALGDVDGDGDLDLVAGNWGQRNRLYLNNGTADPFAGMAGIDVTADAQATALVALGDVDRDGALDMVAGNLYTPNRLYRRALYHTGQGRAASLRVNAGPANVTQAQLTPVGILPPHTGVTYWLSNDGGGRWFLVRPGIMFVFPTVGSDLRWRAELHSVSPIRTPRVDEIAITNRYPLYLPLLVR